MAESDGYAQYSPTAEDAEQFSLSPELEKKTVEGMVKHLSKGKTLDEMRSYMETLQTEHGWVERIEQNMKQIVENSDLAETHYITMLQELGRLDVEATASNDEIPDVEDVVAQLIELPQFSIQPEIEDKIFKMWSVLHLHEIDEAYNSSCPGTSQHQ